MEIIRGFLGCYSMQYVGYIPMFRRTVLLPPSGLKSVYYCIFLCCLNVNIWTRYGHKISDKITIYANSRLEVISKLLIPEDEGSTILRNSGIHPPHNTA